MDREQRNGVRDAPLSSFPSHGPPFVSSRRRQCRPKQRFRCRSRMWASGISSALGQGSPAPRRDGDPLYTPPARDPSLGIGPTGFRAERPRSTPGTQRTSRSGGAGVCGVGSTLSGGKTLLAGKTTSAGKGHCQESNPTHEPGSSREPRSMEQRRARGLKAGGTGLGEMENNTSLLASVL